MSSPTSFRFTVGQRVRWSVWPHAVYQIVWRREWVDGHTDYAVEESPATARPGHQITYIVREMDIAPIEETT